MIRYNICAGLTIIISSQELQIGDEEGVSYLEHSKAKTPTIESSSSETTFLAVPSTDSPAVTSLDSEFKRSKLKKMSSLDSRNTHSSPSPSLKQTDQKSISPESNDPSPNICPHCGLYIQTSELQTHLDSKHAFKAHFVCSTCNRVYTRKHIYESHSKNCSKD